MSNKLTSHKNIFIPYLFCLFSIIFSFNNLNAQVVDNSEQSYYIEGLRQYNIGSLDKAKSIFEELIKRKTKNDAVYFYLSNIFLRSNEIKKAEDAMNQAIRLDPENYWYALHLAKIYSVQNNLSKAIAIYEALREKYPHKTELYDEMIDIYINQNNIDKASQVVDDVEKYVGKNEATGLTRYNLLIYQNKKEEAFNYLKDFDKDYSSPRTSTILGDLYSSKQNDTIALSYYKKALSMDPTFIPARFGMAEVYRIRGQFDLYFQLIFPFLANPDVDSRMKVNYMKEILSSQKFVQTFMPQVDTMMNNLYLAHPFDSSVVYTFSLYLIQTGNVDKGMEVLEKNLQNYPESKEAHKQYLTLLYYTESWESLISNSDSALVVFPKDPDFMELKGIGLLQSGKIAESIVIFKEKLSLTRKDSAATVRNLSVLGDLYNQIGDQKECYKYYRKTLKKEPNHIATLNNYSYFLSVDGKSLKKAYKMSKKTIEAEPNNPTYLDTYAWILHKLNRDIEAKAILKHCMVYGGGENATILDHYAEVLFSLKEYDLAYIYWGQADKLDPSLGIAAKMAQKKKEVK